MFLNKKNNFCVGTYNLQHYLTTYKFGHMDDGQPMRNKVITEK